MIVDEDPVVQHRRLRTVLQEMRQQRDLTQQHVAQALDWSPSKVLRIENGEVHVSTTDLKALLAYYGVEDQQQVDRLVEMARAARTRLWAADFRGVLRPEFQRYLAYESAAARVHNFQALLLPGLLQTEQYARATARALSPPGTGEDVVERLVEARMRRQQLLTRDDAPGLVFVVDESVIRRRVGGTAVMAEQLQHLRRVAQHPNVELRVIPFDAGVHPGMIGSFVVVEFESAEDDVVYVEDLRGTLTAHEKGRDVASYKEAFTRLLALAPPDGYLDETIGDILSRMSATGEG